MSILATKKILISPYSRALRSGAPNPKNYPYWNEVVSKLKEVGHQIIQLAYGTEPVIDGVSYTARYVTLAEAEQKIQECDVFISVDNWVHHYAHLIGKFGIVIWSRSDPSLFGYKDQVNLLKDRKYLRPRQFEWWEQDTYENEAFIDSNAIINAVKWHFS